MLILLFFVLPLASPLFLTSNSAQSCILSESGPSPYLVRIFENDQDPITHGHGSLIREDKVLSTCTPFRGLPRDLVSQKWRLSGYNFEEKCEQRRDAIEIEIHDACKTLVTNPSGSVSLDLAIWTVEPFGVEGMPFLWGKGKRIPPPLRTVSQSITSLVDGRTDCETVLFKDANSTLALLQPNTTVEFIGDSECSRILTNISITFGRNYNLSWDQTRTNAIKKTSGTVHDGDDIAGANHIYCVYGQGIKWNGLHNESVLLVTADWYSGAALITPHYKTSSIKIPIGLFSRAIAAPHDSQGKRNCRIILGFHEGVYEFLTDSGIEIPSPKKYTLSETENRPVVAKSAKTLATEATKPIACKLTESGLYPYLIRISETYSAGIITYGHGSLIKEDKVLSTCTPFKSVPKFTGKTNWTLTGYDFEKKCKQRREPKRIIMHESCHNESFPLSSGPITRDFALWTVIPFEMEGMPFLWGNGKPQPFRLTTVITIIDSLQKLKKAISIGLFKDRYSEELELQPHAKTYFIDRVECLDMLKNVTIQNGDATLTLSGSNSIDQESHNYFCGRDFGVKWIKPRSMSYPIYADWYSGAAVMYESPSGMKVPIGLLSRGVTTRSSHPDPNFRIIMGFNEGVYEFLCNNGIEPSVVKSEPKVRHDYSTSEFLKIEDNSTNPYFKQPRNKIVNHQSRISTRRLWISHSALLSCLIYIF